MPAYDVAIVGARAAGAATALLLARAGHRVLVVDRSRYGSDTLSTHAIVRGGILQLDRWGLLDTIRAAGTPPADRVTFNYAGRPVVVDLDHRLYAPRRTVLDRVLVDAAREAGADIRFGAHVTDVRRTDDGHVGGIVVRERDGAVSEIEAEMTVGADGRRSGVARAVGAPVTAAGTHTTAFYYGYWSGLEDRGFEWHFGPEVGAGVIPTNDGLACVFVGTSPERFHTRLRPDPARNVERMAAELPSDLAARLAAGERNGPLRGFAGLPGWLRRPFGDGWALVGDAGSFKDPITAHGLTDAMRDAELLARAIDEGLTGVTPMMAALAGYERVRDDVALPILQTTDAVASLDWSMEELQALHLDLSREMKAEVRVIERLGDLPTRSRTRTMASL